MTKHSSKWETSPARSLYHSSSRSCFHSASLTSVRRDSMRYHKTTSYIITWVCHLRQTYSAKAEQNFVLFQQNNRRNTQRRKGGPWTFRQWTCATLVASANMFIDLSISCFNSTSCMFQISTCSSTSYRLCLLKWIHVLPMLIRTSMRSQKR